MRRLLPPVAEVAPTQGELNDVVQPLQRDRGCIRQKASVTIAVVRH